MDDPKSLVGLPTSPAGNPPPNLPVVNLPAPPLRPSIPPDPAVPKSPIPVPVPPPTAVTLQPPKLPVPSTPALPHSPPQPQGNITLPRSSIRTMESDLKSVQAGQAPKGVEIKPSVLPAETKPVAPLAQLKPAPPPVLPPIGVKLGEAEKRTAPLPGQIIAKPESKPIPPKPVPPPTLPIGPAKLAVPPRLSLFANKKLLALAAIVILAIVGMIFYLGQGQETEIVTPTFTPRSSASASPSFETISKLSLNNVFGKVLNLEISPATQDPKAVLEKEAVNLSNNNPDKKNILVSPEEGVGANYKFVNFLDRFLISFPINLTSAVDNDDFGLILTKATEFFDQNGKAIASPSAEMLLKPQIALVVRVIDKTDTETQLNSWEDTLVNDLASFYDLGFSGSTANQLSGGLYQGVKIRYINFPFPDKTIDYAIVSAKNGDDYLIVASSREQMYSIIDQLLGF